MTLVAVEGVSLWERQPDETDKAWAAFQVYRNLAPVVRTIQKAAKDSGKTSRYFEGWSRKWSWPARAAAWDREQDRVAKRASDAEIQAMVKRQLGTAKALQSLGQMALIQRIKYVQKKIKADAEYLSELSVGEITRLTELGIKLERVLMGEATEIEETRHSVTNDDRRNMMRKIMESPDAVEALDVVIEKLEGQS